MSELTEYLAHKYNNMSKESKSETGLTYNSAYLGGYRQCVVDALEYKPTLNENQQIVFEWLKGNYVQGYGAAVIRTIHLLQKENTIISGSKPITQAYRALNTAEEAVVVKMFADWALEQEEG